MQEVGYPLVQPLPTIPLALASSVRLSILRSMFSFLVMLKFYVVVELFILTEANRGFIDNSLTHDYIKFEGFYNTLDCFKTPTRRQSYANRPIGLAATAAAVANYSFSFGLICEAFDTEINVFFSVHAEIIYSCGIIYEFRRIIVQHMYLETIYMIFQNKI